MIRAGKSWLISGGAVSRYYGRPSKRPEWLCVDRTLGCLGLEDSLQGLRRYREYMNKRAMELVDSDNLMVFNVSWADIRRGWCFGTDQFKADMLEKIDGLSRKRESFSGAEVRLHDERQAKELLRKGLDILKVDESSLVLMSKGADEKALLAWLIRRHTVVSSAWIADRLHMGRADCLSRYPKRIDETRDDLLVEKRELLREITILRD